VQDLSEAVVKLSCVNDNTFGSVHNTLQSVSDRLSGWLRGTAVERRSVASELSLSCARPVADG